MSQILVLGAGRQGTAAAFDLLRQPGIDRVVLADSVLERASAAAARLGPRASATKLDVTDARAAVQAMRGSVAVLSAVPYRYNVALAKAAIEAKASFGDLGGNNDVVRATLALDAEAKRAGVLLVPDLGLTPGMTNVLVAHGMQGLDGADEVRVRVGGLPQKPEAPFHYALFFSVSGLVNEYVERALVLRDGKVRTVDAMTDVEDLEFPAPWGKLEAFNTSGGLSTLPETFAGRVREMDCKTIRYRGYCSQFRSYLDLGLGKSEAIDVDGMRVSPRAVFEKLLERALPHDVPDVVLVRVSVVGRQGGRTVRRTYEMIDLLDPATGFTGMMRTTAFPAAIVIHGIASGAITARGAVPAEQCVPPDWFLAELPKRGISVAVREA